MKKILIITLAAACFTLAGCSSIQKLLLTPSDPVIIPAQTAQTNLDGTITPAVAAQTNAVLVPSTNLVKVIEGAQTLTPILPPPFDWAANAALALATAGLGIFASVKSGKLKTANSITQAVVAGVESAANPQTKVAIQTASTAAGVADALDNIVQAVTAGMKK